jgi:UDP-N-acetylmuramate--alanine ligase
MEVNMDRKLHVHFMGIGGSGMAPIAVIAKQSGFEVSGCDYSASSYYSDALRDSEIDIQIGHHSDHLEGVDILAITPAILDINPDHPELVEGRKRNIVMTWQEFMGKYLQKDKYVIAVAGTHGKSTTTVLMGLTAQAGGLDPIVEAGTIYRPWGGGFRISESDYFICEADEFNCNFLNYSPSLIIINNIEMDHPEFFRDFTEFKEAFKKFILKMKHPGILVVNEESQGIREILSELGSWLAGNRVKVIGYYLEQQFDYPFDMEYRGEISHYAEDATEFTVYGPDTADSIRLGLPGAHNVSNALGVFGAAKELGIDITALKEAFMEYRGIGRRTELVEEVNGIKVFDDYGHHPTAIAAVLDTFRITHPGRRVIAVIEPHQISRLKLFPREFIAVLNKADETIVTKTYVGREIHKNLEPVDIGELIREADTKRASYLEDGKEAAAAAAAKAGPGDIIVVFGAGNSYKFTKLIIENLKAGLVAQ